MYIQLFYNSSTYEYTPALCHTSADGVQRVPPISDDTFSPEGEVIKLSFKAIPSDWIQTEITNPNCLDKNGVIDVIYYMDHTDGRSKWLYDVYVSPNVNRYYDLHNLQEWIDDLSSDLIDPDEMDYAVNGVRHMTIANIEAADEWDLDPSVSPDPVEGWDILGQVKSAHHWWQLDKINSTFIVYHDQHDLDKGDDWKESLTNINSNSYGYTYVHDTDSTSKFTIHGHPYKVDSVPINLKTTASNEDMSEEQCLKFEMDIHD